MNEAMDADRAAAAFLAGPPAKRAFDGPDYDPARDFPRLAGQIGDVFELMKDGKFRTLTGISDAIDHPEASISAQLRHLRKEKWGSHTVNKEHLGHGLYAYQLILNRAPAGAAA